jgi:hypothetical protein
MTTRKKTASSPAKSNLDAAAEQRSDSAKAVGIDVSPGDIAEARKDGAIEAEKEAGKDSYRYATDGNLLADPEDAPRTFPGYDNIMQYEPLLHQGPDAFEAAIAEDAPTPLPEEKVYGLLALERNGQNRTPYVQAAMKRLGLKASELPGGGPGYTNDVHPLSELKDHA